MRWCLPVFCRVVLFLPLLSCLFLSICPIARSAQVTLAWDQATSPDVVGYKIYYGTASGSYTAVIDAGNSTSYTVPGLQDGTVYYLATTAYDATDDESNFSSEVIYHGSALPKPAPTHYHRAPDH
jgi:fibronectin type 3 domain-containing protein